MAATFKNFATTKLTQNLSASATTAYVSSADAAKLPIADGADSWFYLVIQRATDSSYFEIVKVTNKVDGALTIVREQEGTLAKAFLLNDLAEARLTTMGLLDAFIGKSDWRLWAVTEAQFESERATNRRRFAASGYESFGKHDANNLAGKINEGLWSAVAPDTANTLLYGRTKLGGGVGASRTYEPVVNVAGVGVYLLSIDGYKGVIKFPQAPDGKTTYNKSTGVNTVHASTSAAFAAQAADPTNVEVVINRVDGWLKEVWAEEVSATNPYIYSNGLPQSLATTMDGIATTASNRPASYYAFFKGDTSSKGKGLDFFSLTDAQKKKVLANPKNNIVLLNDGRLIQWRLRIRTFAGSGNGDWARVDSAGAQGGFPSLSFNNYSRVGAQGAMDVPHPVGSGDATQFRATLTSANDYPELGLFTVLNQSADIVSAGGECYALFGGTVNRLNQGAYHPSFNPSGSARGVNSEETGWARWWQGDAKQITSVSACFIPYSSGGVADSTGYVGSIAGGEGLSGRPDQRLYDAIYANGQGGVCRDMRYSAYGKTLEDSAEADQRVKNGIYRGFEKVRYTYPYAERSVFLNPAATQIDLGEGTVASINLDIGDTLFLVSSSAVLVCKNIAVTRYPVCSVVSGAPISGTSDNYYLFVCKEIGVSCGGGFLQTDVIGNPANILANPALANGWQGSWIPVIPDGTTKPYPYARKKVGENLGRGWAIWTTDSGASWTMGRYTNSTSEVLNIFTNSPLASIFVALVPYQAFAKQTEPAANTEVYGKDSGIGNVFQNSWYGLATFQETLIGKVATGIFGGDSLLVTKYNLDGGRKLHADPSAVPTHLAIDLPAPINNSVGIKVLNYNVNINQQAFIQYAYTELKHNGTNWGDDSKVAIYDNQSAKLDTNNTTVLVGTARLKEPLGWIKNNV